MTAGLEDPVKTHTGPRLQSGQPFGKRGKNSRWRPLMAAAGTEPGGG
jgi:hypothetical protein